MPTRTWWCPRRRRCRCRRWCQCTLLGVVCAGSGGVVCGWLWRRRRWKQRACAARRRAQGCRPARAEEARVERATWRLGRGGSRARAWPMHSDTLPYVAVLPLTLHTTPPPTPRTIMCGAVTLSVSSAPAAVGSDREEKVEAAQRQLLELVTMPSGETPDEPGGTVQSHGSWSATSPAGAVHVGSVAAAGPPHSRAAATSTSVRAICGAQGACRRRRSERVARRGCGRQPGGSAAWWRQGAGS